MTYPRQAIEACEALSHPLPHPTMPIDHSTTDDRITEWLHQADGGAKVDTQHPGPIEMLDSTPSEYERATRRDLYGIALVGFPRASGDRPAVSSTVNLNPLVPPRERG